MEEIEDQALDAVEDLIRSADWRLTECKQKGVLYMSIPSLLISYLQNAIQRKYCTLIRPSEFKELHGFYFIPSYEDSINIFHRDYFQFKESWMKKTIEPFPNDFLSAIEVDK